MLFSIDPLHSLVEFRVRHLQISIVKGSFTEMHGTIALDVNDPQKTVIDAVVRTESIYTGAPRRDAHLRSADFLDVVSYPTISFKSTQVRLQDQTHCYLDGNFTMHGVTRPITFLVTYGGAARDPLTNAWRIGASASTTVDRRDYGMNFSRLITDGIVAIGNETQIEINMEAFQTA